MSMNEFAKATYGSLVSGLAALGTSLADGHIEPLEIVGIASAVVVAFGVIFQTTNAAPKE